MISNLFKILICLVCTLEIKSQENILYKVPPQEILELVDVKLPPRVLMDERNEYMVYLFRDNLKSIEQLSEPEVKLAGLRLNPDLYTKSRANYYNNVKIVKMDTKNSNPMDVKGLPTKPQLANIKWSPDQTKIAMTNTTKEGVELWFIDLKKGTAKKLSKPIINATLGNPIAWFKDGKYILAKFRTKNSPKLINSGDIIPQGPRISTNDGKKAQNRTYQDLLKNRTDERNFEILTESEIFKISLKGKAKLLLEKNHYEGVNFSPSGKYILISTIKRPYSYLVPYYRFPMDYTIYSSKGAKVKTLYSVPLTEELPKGFMAVREGPRSFTWRSDKPESIIFVKALDGGDPLSKVENRDEVFEIKPPFSQNETSILKTQNRHYRVDWCNDTLALGYDYWWNNRNTKVYKFNPSENQIAPKIIIDRNYQDKYNDPGTFIKKRNSYGESILAFKSGSMFLKGEGFGPDGQFPFIDEINVNTLKKKRIYESTFNDKKETLIDYIINSNKVISRIESPNDYPNYYHRMLKNNQLRKVTNFSNPFKGIMNVQKEIVKYQRSDGLDLSATLYLPETYNPNNNIKLPLIMWAYPREFKDNSSASQITQNANEFTYPYWGSPIYWLTRGYAILDDVSFPIVGEDDKEPNDLFREQLIDNAKAAIDKVNSLGYIDKNKIAIGGHSYGAFMVANLISHTQLFAAGIARSGAYNRTLTPFGFQSEERSYWEAPEVYYKMSPFMHADKVDTPILLIHGEEDNNSGTYPLQSERYFNALKGLGAETRLVMLPKESHGYRAKESILHMLWEQDIWLEKYVKNN